LSYFRFFDVEIVKTPFFGAELLRPTFVRSVVEGDPAGLVEEIAATPIFRQSEWVLEFARPQLLEQVIEFSVGFVARIDGIGHNSSVLDEWKSVFEALVAGGLRVKVFQFSDKIDAGLVALVGAGIRIFVEPSEDQSHKALLKGSMHILHLIHELLAAPFSALFDEVGYDGTKVSFHDD
jgi:hypothetical protein